MGTIASWSILISFAILMFITFLVLIALFPPRCLGYWHGLLCFQCFPKEWRCFGHIIISLSLEETGKSKIPALVRISSYSVNLSQDKWHEFKWLEMLSVQSSRQTDSVTPLEVPHVPLYFDKLDKKHANTIFVKFTVARGKKITNSWLAYGGCTNQISFFLVLMSIVCCHYFLRKL